jgi:hypothetical protein
VICISHTVLLGQGNQDYGGLNRCVAVDGRNKELCEES